jgi:hypothetical protein
MSTSKRKHEGYLLVDHRGGPGLTADVLQAHGLPPDMGRGVFESATITCKHCQQILILNPLRTRARGYCPKCDHFICDLCDAARVQNGYACTTFEEQIDRTHEVVIAREQNSRILGL